MRIASVQLDRRSVLRGATGLVIALQLPGAGQALASDAEGAFEPNAFVKIASDDTITILIKHHEMGQGVSTGLATLVAEELDADWNKVRVEYAPADEARYKNLFNGIQITGGSTSIANSFEQMREAGAMARAMLVSAAAKTWNVAEAGIRVANGELTADEHRATFGEMANAASLMTPPATVTLKAADRFSLIGKKIPRIGSKAKSTGAETYTIDVKLPGLLTAVTARPPTFGSKVKSFDASQALKVPGVKRVVQIPEGVAVVASGMWPALQGREALKIVWDDGAAETRSSEEIIGAYRTLLDAPGIPVVARGDNDAGWSNSKIVVSGDYEFPFLAHAPMEPLNCVVWLHDGMLETWSGHQAPSFDRANAAKAAGLAPERVVLHPMPSGGSFGRRVVPDSEFVVEAVNIAKAMGGILPIRLQRTREDDIRSGYFRPMYVHRIKAGIDAAGNISSWSHRIVGQSILGFYPDLASWVKGGIDRTSVEGAANVPYAMSNVAIDLHSPKLSVPVQTWRSVGSTHTAFAVETMIDELAAAAGRDPVAFRLALLQSQPRLTGVLKLAAEKSGWGSPLPKGVARGVAVHESFKTYVAQVVELHLDSDGRVCVDRVVIAVDCGQVVNPDIVTAQMEGGVGFGLSPTLHSRVSLDKGQVTETNFDTYEVLRFNEMPATEVHIVPSTEKPSGVGEPGVPPIAPAVANALAILCGKRFRALPISLAG